MGYNQFFGRTKLMLEMHFNGPGEILLSTDTLQYSNYDKYESEMFNKDEKLKRHAEIFPEDCKRAFELGVRWSRNVMHRHLGGLLPTVFG